MEIFGYEFKNPALLEEALTTPAYRMECPSARDNQRLEFLEEAGGPQSMGSQSETQLK